MTNTMKKKTGVQSAEMGNCNLYKVERVGSSGQWHLSGVWGRWESYMNIWGKYASGRGQNCIWSILGIAKMCVANVEQWGRDVGEEFRNLLRDQNMYLHYPVGYWCWTSFPVPFVCAFWWYVCPSLYQFWN